jgi:phage terminase large subunit-like protein
MPTRPYWQSWIAKWIGEFGKEVVIEWWTNRRKPMSAALEGFDTAIREGTLSHDGAKDYERHIGNARRLNLPQVDEQGKHVWLIQKERPDSPHKIDLAMAGC